MKTYYNILVALLMMQTANAVGSQNFDSKIGCQINNGMDLVSGLAGSVYYYTWRSYNSVATSGSNNFELYTTEAYLSGSYIGDGSIMDKDHTVFTSPGVIANDVTATELYFSEPNTCDSDGNCRAEVWMDLPYFSNSDGTNVSGPIKTFTLHMNGYIIPEITGQYTLNLAYIDDLAIINVGSSNFKNTNCCDNFSPTGDVSGANKIQLT